MLELSTYHSIYKTVKTVKTLLFIIFTGFFIYRSYELFLYNQHFISEYFKINIKTNNAPLINYFWQQLDLLKNYAIFMFSIWIIFYIYSHLPIKKQWLLQWDHSNEINPILGRSISSHFRYHKYINHKTLFTYNNYSDFEKNMLYLHSQNKDLYQFLNKYDQNFSQDIK